MYELKFNLDCATPSTESQCEDTWPAKFFFVQPSTCWTHWLSVNTYTSQSKEHWVPMIWCTASSTSPWQKCIFIICLGRKLEMAFANKQSKAIHRLLNPTRAGPSFSTCFLRNPGCQLRSIFIRIHNLQIMYKLKRIKIYLWSEMS